MSEPGEIPEGDDRSAPATPVASIPSTQPPSPLMTTPQQAHAEQRTEPVTVPGLTRTYPAPPEFDDFDVRDRSKTTIIIFAKVPWFHHAAVLHGGVYDRYADERGMLPGDIHLTALTTFAWLEYFCCNYVDLRIESLDSALEAKEKAERELKESRIDRSNTLTEHL